MIRQDLYFTSPYLNAAGTLGFRPPARWPLPEVQGAFITNPISQGPRTPAAERAALPFPGGFLLHSGLPNPGLSRVLRHHAQRWAQSALPVWVHLLAEDPAATAQMVRRLEGLEGVMAVEIGLPTHASPEECLEIVQAAAGELPLSVCVPVTQAREAWVARLPEAGAAGITLAPPRGTLIREQKPVSGRLYGSALLPQAVAAVQALRKSGLTLLAACGILSRADADMLLAAGASAVQLDVVLWRGWAD